MAVEYGECGSTKEVRRVLALAGVRADSLVGCRKARAELESTLERLATEAESVLQEHLDQLEVAFEERQARTAERVAELQDGVERTRGWAAKVRAMGGSPSSLGGFAAGLVAEGIGIGADLHQTVVNHQKSSAYASLARERTKIEKVREAPEEWLESERAQAAGKLQQVRQAVQGAAFRGAVGEEVVADRLRRLPDAFTVIHDVQLSLGAPVQMLGVRAHRVQVDHVVVGPTGVFVLETKNWSREYATRADVRDPYVQAAVAGHFVRCTLRNRGVPVKVSSVVVKCGWLPPKRSDAWVWVTDPDRLVDRVQRANGRLNSQTVGRAVGVLRR